MMEIGIENLSFDYPGVNVLHDITAHMDKPELYGILGPNGVGKSTLIHCMNRILEPTMGTVMIDGIEVRDYRIKDLAKTMGYVPCASSDAFPMTVVDTVLVGRHPHSDWRVTKHDFDIVYEALHTMGIEELAMRPFNELSAGQKQKVMLARGLVQEPKALLLDEPTANLDIHHQYAVTKMLRRITRQKGILVVMICHDINIAAKYCDKIIMMSKGTVYAVGTPKDVITEKNLEEVYNIECRIIGDGDSPHVMVKDDSLDEDTLEPTNVLTTPGDVQISSVIRA